MNEEPLKAPTYPSANASGFQALLASRRSSMFGVAEIAALCVSCFVLILVLVSYLYFLLPARSRLQTLKADRAQLLSNLQRSQDIARRDRSVQETVDRLAASLEHFEKSGLASEDQGRMDLYEQLNELIVKNSLRNTSGPTYTALEPAGSQTPGKATSTRWQSAYPGIAVDVTVEGPYQNVRRFIREIENSKQFVVINQVELQRATQNNSSLDAAAATGSGSNNSLVSLQLNMATYFQRGHNAQE